MFVHRYIRYPFSEGTGPLGQIWAGYPHTGHCVLVGVGRINIAVPKPHAGLLLCWVQEVCPSADVLWENSLRVGTGEKKQAGWRLKNWGWSGRFKGLQCFIITNRPLWCYSVKLRETFAACHSFLTAIVTKTHTFPFAARRPVARHSALTFMPLLMLPSEIVHSGISKSVVSS